MNKYKIEFKQIFNRLVTIYAEDEEQAMKVVEQTYLKTDLLDDNEKDLVGIEAKILEKNGEKVDRKEEIPENFENFLDENDIEYLEGLTNEIEENLGEIKEVLGAIGSIASISKSSTFNFTVSKYSKGFTLKVSKIY